MKKDYSKLVSGQYRKNLWAPFRKAIANYQLIEDGDHVAVCISGGKDSMIMALLIKQLLMNHEIAFKATYIVLNPGYEQRHLDQIKANALRLQLDLEIFDIDIFEQIAIAQNDAKQCYLCARKRRGHLYQKAQQLGCNKIALGHHQDDLLETLAMNLFFKGTYATLMPKLHSKNFEPLQLIRPLILVEETAIKRFVLEQDFYFLSCACPHEDRQKAHGDRQKARRLLDQLFAIDPRIKDSLLHSQSSINLEQIFATRSKGTKKNFLENY